MSPSNLPLKLVVGPRNMRSHTSVPDQMNLAGTAQDFYMAHLVVYIGEDGQEIVLKQTNLVADTYHIVLRPITRNSSLEDIDAYLNNLQLLLAGT